MHSLVSQSPAVYNMMGPKPRQRSGPVIQQIQLPLNLDRDIRQLLVKSRTRNDTVAARHAHLLKVAKGFQTKVPATSSFQSGNPLELFVGSSRGRDRWNDPIESDLIEQGPPSVGGSTFKQSIKLENIRKERVDIGSRQNSTASQRRPKSRKKSSGQWPLPAAKRMNMKTRSQFPEIKTRSLYGSGWMAEVAKVVPDRIPISTPVEQEIDFKRLNLEMAEKARTGKNSSPSTYFQYTSTFKRSDFEIHPEWFSEKLYVQRFMNPSVSDRGVPRLSLPNERGAHTAAPHSARTAKSDRMANSYRPIHSAR